MPIFTCAIHLKDTIMREFDEYIMSQKVLGRGTRSIIMDPVIGPAQSSPDCQHFDFYDPLGSNCKEKADYYVYWK